MNIQKITLESIERQPECMFCDRQEDRMYKLDLYSSHRYICVDCVHKIAESAGYKK